MRAEVTEIVTGRVGVAAMMKRLGPRPALALVLTLNLMGASTSAPDRAAPTTAPLDARTALDRLGPPIFPATGPGPARFVLRDRGVSAFFTQAGLSLSLVSNTSVWGLHWSLVGARRVEPRPQGLLPGRVNYLVGDRSTWRTELPTYRGLTYPAVLPGADLELETKPGGIKYTLRLEHAGTAGTLVFRYEGATRVRVVDGGQALAIETDVGALREEQLHCFQPTASGLVEVPARYAWVRQAEGPLAWEYGIELPTADPALPLVLDPTLAWASYLGGSNAGSSAGTQGGKGIAVDGAGNAYVVGSTTSTDFPSTGGFDATLGGGTDVFITKVNAAGSSLAWSSYLGGAGRDSASGIAVDAAGNAYVTGDTDSVDFPTSGGFDTTLGGSADVFVTKVNANGSMLAWSSYLGGSSADYGGGIAVDTVGNLIVVGTTTSTDFPSPAGFDTTLSGFSDAFVTQVNASGSSLAWSSYLGGSAEESALGIAMDATGNAYVAGETWSSDFPAQGGFATLAGLKDAFVTKVNTTGSSLVWSSYLGGSAFDRATCIAVDIAGNAYVAGSTSSNNFPSAGGFDGARAGSLDGFVAKVNAAGSSLAWSSYLPDNSLGGYSTAEGIAVDAAGNVYVVGSTVSQGFSAAGGFDTALGGTRDAFVTKVNPSGSSLAWSSYLGGTNFDSAGGIAVDPTGNAYITGNTSSTDFPSSGGFDTTLAGFSDAFVTKVAAAGASLVWSSYLGGSVAPLPDRETAVAAAQDTVGNLYVAGHTNMSDFPSAGGFDPTPGGSDDVFITKLNGAGSAIAWSSYLGGASEDLATGIAVDAADNVYVAGSTRSTDFPAAGGFDATLSGATDAFVTKVNAGGSSLDWSSYLGGSEDDVATGIAVDAAGEAYVTGITLSTDFPTGGGFDATLGGSRDAFVTKVNAVGSSLAWSSYLGGSGEDWGTAIAVDMTGNVYLTGYTRSLTRSTDFPAGGGFDATLGGSRDAFVTKVNAVGSSLAWSSLLGGSDEEWASAIAVDITGNVYVAGRTRSPDFPSAGGFDTALGGFGDAFVTKVNAAGSSLAWSSYLGGSSYEEATGIAVDIAGNVSVTGFTQSTDFPMQQAFDSSLGGSADAFVTQVEAAGSSLVWSSFLGGSAHDAARSIVVEPGGSSVTVVGLTESCDFPSVNGFDSSLGGSADAFVVRVGAISLTQGTVNDGPEADIDLQDSATTLSANWVGFGGAESSIARYEWALGTTAGGDDVQPFTDVGSETSASNSALSLTPGTTYFATVRATGRSGLTATASSDGVLVRSLPLRFVVGCDCGASGAQGGWALFALAWALGRRSGRRPYFRA